MKESEFYKINSEVLKVYIETIKNVFQLDQETAEGYARDLYNLFISLGGNPNNTESLEKDVRTIVGRWVSNSQKIEK